MQGTGACELKKGSRVGLYVVVTMHLRQSLEQNRKSVGACCALVLSMPAVLQMRMYIERRLSMFVPCITLCTAARTV